MIDFAIVGICLLFLIVGLVKGFARSLISLLGWIGAIIITFLLAKNFAGFLKDNFSIYDSINNALLDKFNSQPSLTTPILLEGLTGEEITSAIQLALHNAGIPNFLTKFIVPGIVSAIPPTAATITLSAVISNVITNLILMVIAGLILFVLLRIGFAVLEHIVGKIIDCSFISPIDHTLGSVLGLAKGVFIVYAILLILTPLSSASFMSGYKEKLDDSTLGAMMADNNVLGNILYENLDIGKWVSEILNSDKTNEKHAEKESFARIKDERGDTCCNGLEVQSYPLLDYA